MSDPCGNVAPFQYDPSLHRLLAKIVVSDLPGAISNAVMRGAARPLQPSLAESLARFDRCDGYNRHNRTITAPERLRRAYR